MNETDELVTFYSAQNPTLAELIKNALEEEGVSCQIENPHQGGLTGVLQVRLAVRAQDVDRARRILEELTPLSETAQDDESADAEWPDADMEDLAANAAGDPAIRSSDSSSDSPGDVHAITPDPALEGDVLVFDQHTWAGRLLGGPFLLLLAAFLITTAYNEALPGVLSKDESLFHRGLLGFVLILAGGGAIFFFGVGLHVIFGADKLVLDFVRQEYHLASGSVFYLRVTIGDFSDIACLRMRCHTTHGRHSDFRYTTVSLVWKDEKLGLFELRVEGAAATEHDQHEPQKRLLRAFADQLAARLHTSVAADDSFAAGSAV